MKWGRFKLNYRGWTSPSFIRFKPIMIGQTRLYTVGPIALFVEPKD